MGRKLGQFDVSSAFERPGSSSHQQHRQWRVIVLVAVAHTAAVQDEGMVEKASIAIRCRFQLFQKVSEDAVMVRIELGKPVHVGA